jgi:glycosyltransferase involved in cell wall biosynthesis
MTQPDYSTTRNLITVKPACFDRCTKGLNTLLKTPDNEYKIAEGGLRLKGLYKSSSEEKPLITVVTVVYNGAEYLEDTIKSVIEQAYDNVEYIIVDGGSTDGTLDIIKKYEDAIDYWVSEPDKGIYDAMNKGVDLGSGDWINFMNADDYFINNNAINKINFRECDFVYGNILLKDKDYVISSGKEITLDDLKFKGICHQSVFVKKTVFVRLGSFNLAYAVAADYDFFVRVFKSAFVKKYINTNIAYMRMGGVSDSGYIKSLDEKLSIIKINFPLKTYAAAFVYQYFYERPRNKVRAALMKAGLIKYWRMLRD